MAPRKTAVNSASSRSSRQAIAQSPLGDHYALKKQASRVLRRLKADYPDAHCALEHESPFQLLIATILSAQCTDKRVNMVTKDLFVQFPRPDDFAAAQVKKIEKAIQSTGFYRNKAKNIKSCCKDLVEKHEGEIPQELEALTKLAGVGRKTANVVLGTGFGLATGVVVDTHVGRLSRRLGLTTNTDAVKVERDLMPLIPKKRWVQFSHQMIDHGRAICDARKPKCEDCSMRKFCPQIGV
ncbi:MAG: endonuclease III [Lacipirellulaceae bacterium]